MARTSALTTPMRAYRTAAEVAALWGCSARQVRRLAQRGRLAGLRIGPSEWRFSASAIADYERHNTSAVTTSEVTTVKPASAQSVGAATELDGAYVPIVPGSVPWRPEVLQ